MQKEILVKLSVVLQKGVDRSQKDSCDWVRGYMLIGICHSHRVHDIIISMMSEDYNLSCPHACREERRHLQSKILGTYSNMYHENQ